MKAENQKIIIIPGFGESSQDDPYRQLEKQLLRLNSSAVIQFYNPIWDRRTIKHWIDDFKIKFEDKDLSQFTLIGFSMGAYIVLALTKEQKFKKIILASLSPYFKENLKRLPIEAVQFMGKKRMRDFANIAIPFSINSPATFLFGDKDWEKAISQAKKLASAYDGKCIMIENTGHELTERYIEKITTEA